MNLKTESDPQGESMIEAVHCPFFPVGCESNLSWEQGAFALARKDSDYPAGTADCSSEKPGCVASKSCIGFNAAFLTDLFYT